MEGEPRGVEQSSHEPQLLRVRVGNFLALEASEIRALAERTQLASQTAFANNDPYAGEDLLIDATRLGWYAAALEAQELGQLAA